MEGEGKDWLIGSGLDCNFLVFFFFSLLYTSFFLFLVLYLRLGGGIGELFLMLKRFS